MDYDLSATKINISDCRMLNLALGVHIWGDYRIIGNSLQPLFQGIQRNYMQINKPSAAFGQGGGGVHVYHFNPDQATDLEISNNKIDVEGTKNVYNEVKNITFFPNPAKDNITFSDFVNKVTVLDMYGKTIKDIIINGTYLDTSNFKKGIYYLKIDSNKTEQNLKLIIE